MQFVFIYCLINPIDNSVFYVGCTSDQYGRLNQHISDAKNGNDYKSEIIREIKQTGNDIEMLILDKCSVLDASFYEEFYIDLFTSFGFKLKQWKTSTYTSMFIGKWIKSSDYRKTVLTVGSNITGALEEISKNTRKSKEFLLELAISQFIEKYKKYNTFFEPPQYLISRKITK